MLDLLHTYTGCPTTGLQYLVLARETLLFYPSSDSVVILNALTLAFVRALAFWEAFPGALHSKDVISRVSVDPGMKLVVASMGSRLATWAMSGVQSDAWRVHSSLHLSEDSPITALDCKSGLLAVGSSTGLSVYTLILENDLPTWSLKWFSSTPALSRVRFSPSLMYMATTSLHGNIVCLYLTTSGRQTQCIPHPRLVVDVNWRKSSANSRDDGILYTVTADATLRIFLPVLDSPQHLQLHAALDLYTALPFSLASQVKTSSVFWIDREVMTKALSASQKLSHAEGEDAQRRRLRDLIEEGWDLFLRILSDGSLVIQAVANVDRRPPTLLKHFTLLQLGPHTLPSIPEHLYILPNPSSPHLLTLVTSPPLETYTLIPSLFFNSRENGLVPVAYGESISPSDEKLGVEQRQIIRFTRTSDGEGLAALRMDGAGESWSISTDGRQLLGKSKWDFGSNVDHVVVLGRGKYVVSYSCSTQLLSVRPSNFASISVPLLISLFAGPQAQEKFQLIGVTQDRKVALIELDTAVVASDCPLALRTITSLPLAAAPARILPIDPMAWSDTSKSNATHFEHDVLLSISSDGELAFWVPEDSEQPLSEWKCTGRVQTGRCSFTLVRCSSMKKTVLVVPSQTEQELTIWDSKQSEFASGLEFRKLFTPSDPIHDLDWASTPDSQSILAVGFTQRVEILCQQRMTYFDESPAWGTCWSIDLAQTIPHPISDSIWLKRGSLLIGAGHFMSLFGHRRPHQDEDLVSPSLFESVARLNGPLDDYHPQMFLQCLLWGKIEYVKEVIVNLANHLGQKGEKHEWHNMPFEEFFRKNLIVKAKHDLSRYQNRYSTLLAVPEVAENENAETTFSSALVGELLERLNENPLPHLTPNEHQSLYVLIQSVSQIDEQRRALDPNGLRYLTTMRIFFNNNLRVSSPNTPTSNGAISTTMKRRQRLRYRDMIWAFHSETQDLLLSSSTIACENNKMTWPDARALGIFIWLRSVEMMRSQMEAIARNHFLSGEARDPTNCSLFYFALGKSKLVHGLWRQAAGHKEQSLMLKFLNNDFSQPRWRTAALKNAFALMSKQRFEYAAAFFLLGGSLRDAVNVCLRNLQDFQLAVALSRVVEQDEEGPIFRDILNTAVLPTAFREGNRWLASWAFWMLRRRDLAVRVLVSPLQDLAPASVAVTEIGEPHYDDPSLALLFSELKTKTLQTAKGTSEISGRTEFNFVLEMARVFCRMGCHALALDLVRSWSFDRPSAVIQALTSPVPRRSSSPLTTRFALEPALRRRSSILIDMDITALPPTRPASPSHNIATTSGSQAVDPSQSGDDSTARKVGIGSLIKSAKQDLSVPDFDMGAFF